LVSMMVYFFNDAMVDLLNATSKTVKIGSPQPRFPVSFYERFVSRKKSWVVYKLSHTTVVLYLSSAKAPAICLVFES